MSNTLPALPCYLNGEYTALPDAKDQRHGPRASSSATAVYEVVPVPMADDRSGLPNTWPDWTAAWPSCACVNPMSRRGMAFETAGQN
jgi:hypothetical protein